ncbi:hypothetical protein COB72_09270 [bacterium]|nr:MAG: hypothetical protein COB72_09270 [bacterium]
MRSQTIIMVFAVVLIAIAGVMGGCSTEQTRSQAQAIDRSAEISEDAAERIEHTLDRYPPGSVEDSLLAQALTEMLPDAIKAQFENAVIVAGDTRAGAQSVADELKVFANANRMQAQTLRDQADKQDDAVNNALAIGGSWLQIALTGTTGLGVIAAAFFRKKHRQAVFVGEDIVTSIEASPAIREAIKGEGASQLRTSMSPVTMRFVKAVREAS